MTNCIFPRFPYCFSCPFFGLRQFSLLRWSSPERIALFFIQLEHHRRISRVSNFFFSVFRFSHFCLRGFWNNSRLRVDRTRRDSPTISFSRSPLHHLIGHLCGHLIHTPLLITLFLHLFFKTIILFPAFGYCTRILAFHLLITTLLYFAVDPATPYFSLNYSRRSFKIKKIYMYWHRSCTSVHQSKYFLFCSTRKCQGFYKKNVKLKFVLG